MKRLILCLFLFPALMCAQDTLQCQLNNINISVNQLYATVIMDTQSPVNAIAWHWEIKVTRANGWNRKFNFITQANVFQHAILPQWNVVHIAATCYAECLFDDILVLGTQTPVAIWQAP